MQVLALLGSPRKGGNSEVLLEAVTRGMTQAGGRVETIRLCELKINPCLNCGGCDSTGECVVKDDMTALYPRILAARRIVLASPIFFYNITAQAKAFVDRCQALWSRQRLLRAKGEWQQDPGQKGFLLAVAATRGAKVFDGATLCMKYAYDAMGFLYGGDFLVKGIDRKGEMAANTMKLKEAEEAGRRFMA
ncbi:MAG: flavodoxin [Deltaproteobacteria bacterium CG_4_10_14_3_um_filter_60_8]|nr:MAG: flavodoxin [Desulfobacterales bacterium CG2_30_60_27]PIP43909.1 MAG: flavodoxin [Deltaproteobacteria bacterium CG23_combo_of_CG06-09_8_20_14_all_60_8]PIY21346.1 MAG: flavodoxin [Deltaproteobacteria bacterium CG_4_10_14_3_um_filter_60_8]